MRQERSSTIIVTILVGISILLTYISMFQLRHIPLLQENNKSHVAYRFKEKRDVIAPVITVVDIPESKGAKSSRQHHVVDSVIEQIKLLDITVSPLVETWEKERYVASLKTQGVQLIFPLSITVDMADYFFKQIADNASQLTFNRVWLSLETRKMHLMDDETYNVLTLDVPMDVFYRQIQAVYTRQMNDFQSVVAVTMEKGVDYIPATSWDEVSKQYVLERMNPLKYTKQIFGVGDVVQNNSTSDTYHYTTDAVDFSIDRNTGFLQLETTVSSDPSSRSQWLIEQMNDVESWSSYSVLFEKRDHTYTFRRYIGRYPVFSENDAFDETVITYLPNENIVRAVSSTDVLQTSILSREKTVRISGYQELSELLVKHKKMFEQFRYIDMAYTLEWSEDHHILTVIPEWYVYYHDQWMPLRVFVSEETL